MHAMRSRDEQHGHTTWAHERLRQTMVGMMLTVVQDHSKTCLKRQPVPEAKVELDPIY